jgi:solute carrier family 25 (mitochondrial oxoglutarate transporter), member 11
LQAYGQIVKEEGLNGLFKGSGINILKSIVMNVSLTGPFDFLNEKMWICFGDTDYNRPVALCWAALVASLATLPIDNIKTRL